METRYSPIEYEMQQIAATPNDHSACYWDCEFLANGQRSTPLKVITVDRQRDYVKNAVDYVVIKVMIPLSLYLEQLYPNRDNLTVTLYRKPLSDTGNVQRGVTTPAQVYRGFPIATSDPMLTPTTELPSNMSDLDIANLTMLHIQLVPREAEMFKLRPGGCNYRRKVPGFALRHHLTRVIQEISSNFPTDSTISGVDMVEPDNQNIREHVLVPQSISLLEMPDFIQKKAGGIYNAGLSYYYQVGCFYVWPKYGLDRFNTNKRTATVFNVPTNYRPGAERTFRETAGQIIIMGTGSSREANFSESVELNQGNGIRFTDGESILGGNVTIDRNKVLIRRGKGNSEFVNEARRSGVNLAPVSKTPITSNPFSQMESLAATKGTVMEIEWQNSNIDRLYPGMPFRVKQYRGDEFIERRGILIGASEYSEPKSDGIVFSEHLSTAVLTLFLSKTPHQPN